MTLPVYTVNPISLENDCLNKLRQLTT